LADLDGSTVTGFVRHYNTAVTGTLLLTDGTITGAYTGSNTRVAQITDSKIGGATTIYNLSGESGTLTVNNSTLAAVTGSGLDTVAITSGTTGALTFRETETWQITSATTGNLVFNNLVTAGTLTVDHTSIGATGTGAITGSNAAVVSLHNSTAGNTALYETGLADLDGSTVTGFVRHYNTAVTGTLLMNSSTITGAYTGSNTRVAQITDSQIGGATIINNLSGASGTLTVNSSTLAAVTATNYDTVSVFDSVTGRITTGTSAVVIASSTIAGATFADVTGTLTDLHVTAGISLTGDSDVFMGDATSRVNGNTVSVGGNAVFTGSNLQLQNISTAVNATSAAAISVGGSGRVYVTDSVLETQVGASGSSGRYIGVIFGNSSASYISVENSRLIAHAEGRGISFQGSDGVVRNTTITTEDGTGVFLLGAANVRFENADILVTGTDAVSGGGNQGMYARGSGTLTVVSSTITTLREDAVGVYISGVDADTVTGILSETVIDTGGAYAYGLRGASKGTIIASGGTIRTAGSYAYGVYLSSTAAGTFTDVDIRTSGSYAYGVCLYTAATGTLTGLDINTLGNNAYGVYLSATAAGTLTDSVVSTTGTFSSALFVNAAAAATVSGGTFATTGDLAHGVRTWNPQAVALTGAAITTSGSAATGVLYNSGAAGVGNMTLAGVAVSTTGADAAALTLVGEEDGFRQTLTVTGGAFTSAQGAALRVGHPDLFGYGAADDFNGAYDLTLDGAVLTGATDAVNLTSLYYRDYTPDDAVDAPVAVTLSATNTVFNGGLTATGTGLTATLTLERSTLTGDITAKQARVTLRLRDHSTLTGTIDPVDLELSGGSNWHLTGPSSLHTLTGASGTITIAGVRGADLTVSDGISGQTSLNLTLSNNVEGRQEIHVVVNQANDMTDDAFTLGNSVGTGMQTYGLDNRLDGAWLVLGGGEGGGFTGGGDAVLNSAAAVSGFWFTQQDNLHQRMGELRYGARASRPQLPGGRDTRAPNDWLDNIWVRSYGQQANINTGISGLKGFSETQYGVDLGTDHAWLIDDHHTLYTGVFAGYGGADRDFHSGYHGSTDSGYGGLYGTWLHKDGWYADALAKGQYFDTSFDGDDHGSYHSYGVGLSLELGRQFQFADGWFAEPSVQVSYLHLLNDGYATDSGMAVGLADSDIVQFYGGARLGRNIKLHQDGWLQPYVKVGGVEQLSSGGQVRAGGGEWRPTTDGARGVIGAGIVYQLTDADQLHLDYEASFGDKYDKPWGLTAGYRHQF
jgi:outer membrane autotransporter protein